MLYTPTSDFGWSVDNFGATWTDAAFGTAHTTGAANTKGTATEVIADTSVTEDVYGIAIVCAGGNLAANVRNFLVDIRTDPAGGTSYTTVIPNLLVNAPAILYGGSRWYFPLYMKAGTAVAVSAQCNAATIGIRVGVRLYGKPSRPELVKVGQFVRAFGANTGTSGGTAITPGSSGAAGAYTASLGTTADELWWWQGGLGVNDTTATGTSQYFDIAAGDATNKVLCCERCVHTLDSSERGGLENMGVRLPYQRIASGANVYMRATSMATPDSSVTCAAYGLGG